MKCVRTVVLEEADQLMKSDFQEQTRTLLSHLSSPSLQVSIIELIIKHIRFLCKAVTSRK